MLAAVSALIALTQHAPEGFSQGVLRLASKTGVTLALEPLFSGSAPPAASLGAFANLNGLTVSRDGSITVLAPTTRTLFGMPKDESVPLEGVEQGDAFLVLVGLLDDGGFRSLVSKNGLSLSGLKTDLQRTLFMAVVAPGGLATIQSQTKTGLHPNGDGSYSYTEPDTSRDPRTARLSLGQGVRVFGKPLKPNPSDGIGSYPPLDLNLHPRPDLPDRAFGIALTTSIPNASRPGALPINPIWENVPVELKGPATVADLVARVRAATRQEIVVDPRLGVRKLVWVGERAPAQDVLLAIAHALRATYRAVGPVLLLTDDALGLGSRASAWGRWVQRAETGVATLVAPYRAAAETRIRAATLPDLDKEALTSVQRERLQRGRGLGMAEFATSEMTDAQRARLQSGLDDPRYRGRFDETRATLNAESRVVVRYAGLDEPVELTTLEGVVDGIVHHALPDPPRAESASSFDASGQAVAFPLAASDLSDAIQAAKDRGLAEVWIVIDPTEARSQRLRSALQAVKATGLRAWIALRPFAGPPADLDLELRPTGTRAPLVSDLATLGAVLTGFGADGVSLLEPAPPGYRGWADLGREEPPRGYTLEARLAFLRRTGYDPIDVTPENMPGRMVAPINSTAFDSVYNSPPEPRLTLVKDRLSKLDLALRSFRKAYTGPLAIQTATYDDERIETWPTSQASPPGLPEAELTGFHESPPQPPLRWRVVLPDGTPFPSLRSPRRPFLLDLSKRKGPLARIVKSLFKEPG